MRTVTIVGASLAGWSVARGLRGGGFDGRITLVGAEPHRPYDRPPLSKAYLAGDLEAGDLSLVVEGEADRVDWVLGQRAVALRPDRTVTLDDGTELAADALVIATGATPRTLPGTDGLGGVHTLRTRDDADALRRALVPGARVVVIGAGFIGAEVASTAHRLGCDVTVVDAAAAPMAGAFGPDLAELVTGLHAAHGVPLRVGVPVAGLRADGGRVTGVALGDEEVLAADVVVVGIGVRPETGWLAGSGLKVDDGVLVDGAGRASTPGVFAVGDLARYPSKRAGGLVRVEHWTHARDHGAAVARTMLGEDVTYDPAPYVWTEQYGTMIQFAGFARPGDQIEVVDGDPAEYRFVAGYQRGGKPVAVLGMRIPRTFGRLRKALAAA